MLSLTNALQVVLYAQSEFSGMYQSAIQYAQFDNDLPKADSLSLDAISQAEATLDNDLIYEAYMAYLTRDRYVDITNVPASTLNKAIAFSDKINDLSKRFNLWTALSSQSLHQYEVTQGSELANRALSYAASTNSPIIKARAYLTSAAAARVRKQYKEAWQNLLNAQNAIYQINSSVADELQKYLTDEICEFYTSMNSFTKAIDLKQTDKRELEEQANMDSVEYMWVFYELTALITISDPTIRIDDNIKKLLSYAERTDNKTLQYFTRALNRNFLINNFELSQFYDQYKKEYKKTKDIIDDPIETAEYCYSNALFFEYKNKIDSATYFYEKAIDAVKKSGSSVRLANYHRRYGEFLYRSGQNQEAYTQLNEALRLAQQANYPPYIINVLDPLDSLARSIGDYKAAYRYSELKHKTQALLANQQIKENLLIMELENQKHQNEIQQEKENEEEKKKHNLQYFAIAVGLITLFLVIVIISSFSVPMWLIEMLGFFSILFIFEFIILILDHKIHHWAHGAPMKIFLVKIAILSVLFPWHHVIEHGVTNFLKKRKQIRRPGTGVFRKILTAMYPWMKKEGDEEVSQH
jgi:hypothetical protein